MELKKLLSEIADQELENDYLATVINNEFSAMGLTGCSVDYLDYTTPEENVLPEVLLNNGKMKKPRALPEPKAQKFFITINISENAKLWAKHDGNMNIFKWFNLTANEQYNFLVYCFKRLISNFSSYHIFFEQTEKGNIHSHLLVETKINKKDLKINFFDTIFNGQKKQKSINNHFKYFCLIKEYDYNLWGEYEKKHTKTYQTLDTEKYKSLEKNIETFKSF